MDLLFKLDQNIFWENSFSSLFILGAPFLATLSEKS